MPRYHFNAYDGIDLPDEDGVVLPDVDVARREAMRFVGALLQERANEGVVKNEWHLDVTDDMGLVLLRFDFLLTESPAISLTKTDDHDPVPALFQELVAKVTEHQ